MFTDFDREFSEGISPNAHLTYVNVFANFTTLPLLKEQPTATIYPLI